MITIQDPARRVPRFALFNLGFRPFFLLAGLYSPIAILLWVGVFVYGWSLPRMPFLPIYWHAHEMIFGYGMAVVAGFLLTAVRNWTGLPTAQGAPLAGLTLLWLAARSAGWMTHSVAVPMTFDLAFDVLFIVAVTLPIMRTRQKQQAGIVAKLVLLALANLAFWLGIAGVLRHGVEWGLYSGVYLLVALMFNMARRVLPFFIERGVGYPVQLTNHAWIDRSNLYLFLAFWIADVFVQLPLLTSLLALLLCVVHSIRLAGWHTRGIWSKPLLWVLYLGYAIVTAGFLLKAVTPMLSLSPTLALHAIALGGVGIMTVGMMARVSLGHTGRNIQQPPERLTMVFTLLVLAVVFRVVLPVIISAHYLLWLAMAQVAWIVAFLLFVRIYAPILVQARVDGQPG